MAGPSDAASDQGMCPLLIQNGTSVTLEVAYQTRSQRIPLGVMGPGSGHSISVACASDRHWVVATSVEATPSGYDQFRAGVAFLTAEEETVLKITVADRIRTRSH